MVVSNPPYIPLDEWNELPRSVKDYEDPRALLGDPGDLEFCGTDFKEGEGGFSFYRQIAGLLPQLLRPGRPHNSETPIVAVEIGADHAQAVQKIFRTMAGGTVGSTEVWKDQFGRDRMVVGWRHRS